MPVPFPTADRTLLTPPDGPEVLLLADGVTHAIASATGLTPLQGVLVQAMFEAMTGHPARLDGPAIDRFGVTTKSDAALAAGSVGPWEPGGISEYQDVTGRARAALASVPYDSFGASVH